MFVNNQHFITQEKFNTSSDLVQTYELMYIWAYRTQVYAQKCMCYIGNKVNVNLWQSKMQT